MARGCIYFQGMRPKYDDSFSCELDPYCSWIEYKEKKVCKNYEEKEVKLCANIANRNL